MNQKAIVVTVGVDLMYDGEVVRVEEVSGTRIVVRSLQSDLVSSVRLSRFAEGAAPLVDSKEPPAQDLAFALSTKPGRELVEHRARRLRWVVYGVDNPDAGALALPGQDQRKAEFACEEGVSVRTVNRWLKNFRERGHAGLFDANMTRRRSSQVEPQWEQMVRHIARAIENDSNFTASYILEQVADALEDKYGAGVIKLPSTATQYRRLPELTKGMNTVKGRSSGRRSIANGPQKKFGRLRPLRPGQYVILDTHDIDVFVLEPVTLRWCPAQLTVAQDLCTRAIVGLRVTAISTKAVDVAGVLFEACHPVQGPDTLPEDSRWSYHGIPENLVYTEDTTVWNVPLVPPEAIVIDNGAPYISDHVAGVCQRLGISIMPARPYTPTDKPTVERFFLSLRHGLLQRLPGYKGPDVYSRGKNPEKHAFLYLHELEQIIREWIASIYHKRTHGGLRVPGFPEANLSPDAMYEIGVGSAGLLRFPQRIEDLYEFLPIKLRLINRYGVDIDTLRYDGAILDRYRNVRSDLGGVHAGKWAFRVDTRDRRMVYFQDPADGVWHTLLWEHADGVGAPFSDEAYQYARLYAQNEGVDPAAAIRKLMSRWDKGMVTDRRERRVAIQSAAENAALPTARLTAAQLEDQRERDSAPEDFDDVVDAVFFDETDSADDLNETTVFDKFDIDLDLDGNDTLEMM